MNLRSIEIESNNYRRYESTISATAAAVPGLVVDQKMIEEVARGSNIEEREENAI